LLGLEFFGALAPEDFRNAQYAAARNTQNATPGMIQRAIAEEFRVKIAQLAVLGAQPNDFFFRKRRDESVLPKFENPGAPNETRAPQTLAQVFDFYKTQRAEFDVTLVPIHVKDLIGELK